MAKPEAQVHPEHVVGKWRREWHRMENQEIVTYVRDPGLPNKRNCLPQSSPDCIWAISWRKVQVIPLNERTCCSTEACACLCLNYIPVTGVRMLRFQSHVQEGHITQPGDKRTGNKILSRRSFDTVWKCRLHITSNVCWIKKNKSLIFIIETATRKER